MGVGWLVVVERLLVGRRDWACLEWTSRAALARLRLGKARKTEQVNPVDFQTCPPVAWWRDIPGIGGGPGVVREPIGQGYGDAVGD